MTNRLRAVSIKSANSIDFLEKAFGLYQDKTLFTVQRPGIDLSQYHGLEVVDSLEVRPGGGWGKLDFACDSSDNPAQILFSSGTEGLPKPIVLSQRNISDVVTRLNAAMAPDETIREYIGVPVTYSFGLGRVRAVSAAGGQFFLPERFDPVEIREMLERGEINAVSAVPTLWRVVLATPDAIGKAGAALRWIEIGSQYMSGAEKLALRQLFPNARIIQHYGLTEASRTTFLDITQTDENLLESVGSATKPARIKIGPDSEICIAGDHVALGVLDQNGSIVPLTDADGWLHTKDKGEIRDGMLYYHGRLDDQMNIAGVNINAENLQRDIIELCGSAGKIAVSSAPDPLRGDAALIAIEREIAERAPIIEKAANIALAKLGVHQSGCVRHFLIDEIPRTDTQKIQRSKIRALYLEQAGRDDAATTPQDETHADLTDTETRIKGAWSQVVGQVAIGPGDTFYDIGGDSLSAVQIGLVMESAFERAAVRATLEGRSLRDVARSQDAAHSEGPATDALPDRTTATWSINITRGLMALAVLMSHWGPGFFQRLGIGTQADYVLGGVYRMGTEGFATVFGIGLGFFFLPRYATDRASVHRRLKLSFILVVSGLSLMAIVRLVRLALLDQAIGGLQISHAFYNILAYYVLAFATAPLWLRYLNAGSNIMARAMLVVVMAIPVTWVMRTILPGQLDSILEWPRLMVVGGYSYFSVSALVFAGIAAGYWYSRQTDLTQASKTLTAAGAFGMAITMLVGIDVLPPSPFATSNSPFFQSLMGYVFYFLLVVFLVGAFDLLLKGWSGLSRPTKAVLQVMIVIGGLALPIYAFHGIVIPIKDILKILGAPGAIALALPMGAFLAAMGYLGWRLRRMYFG